MMTVEDEVVVLDLVQGYRRQGAAGARGLNWLSKSWYLPTLPTILSSGTIWVPRLTEV